MSKTLLLVLAFWVTAVSSVSADGILMRGDTELRGSLFEYVVIGNGSNERRIEVVHRSDRYDGALAAMSFRDRHLQVFGLTAGLMKESCTNGVLSLGDITVSKDPESDEDQDASHPKFFIWEYKCK